MPTRKHSTFTVYQSRSDRQFYWHERINGRIVCDGAEGYRTHAGALRALRAHIARVAASAFRIVT